MRIKFINAVLLMLLLQSINVVASDSLISVDILSQSNVFVAGEQLLVAVEVSPKEQWHTYWRNAGDAGLPTVINFQLPKGVELIDTFWQIPNKFFFEGMANYGYSNKHYIFHKLAFSDELSDEIINLTVIVSWLICKDVCLPGKDTISIDLFKGSELIPNKKFNDLFTHLPIVSNKTIESNLLDNKLLINALEINNILKLFSLEKINNNILFIPYEDGYIDNSQEQEIVSINGEDYLEIKLAKFRTADPDEIKGIFRISDHQAIEVVVFIIN